MNNELFMAFSKALSNKDRPTLERLTKDLSSDNFNKYSVMTFKAVMYWYNSCPVPSKLIDILELGLVKATINNKTWIKDFTGQSSLFKRKNLETLIENYHNLNETNQDSVKRVFILNCYTLTYKVGFDLLMKFPPLEKHFVGNCLIKLFNRNKDSTYINVKQLSQLLIHHAMKVGDLPDTQALYDLIGKDNFIKLMKLTDSNLNDIVRIRTASPLFISLLQHREKSDFDWMTDFDFTLELIEKHQVELFDSIMHHQAEKLFTKILDLVITNKLKFTPEVHIWNAISNEAIPMCMKILDTVDKLNLIDGHRRDNYLNFVENIVWLNISVAKKIKLIKKLKEKGLIIHPIDLASFMPFKDKDQSSFKKMLSHFQSEYPLIDFSKITKPLPCIEDKNFYLKVTRYKEEKFSKTFKTNSKNCKRVVLSHLVKEDNFDLYLFYLTHLAINKKMFNLDLFLAAVPEIKEVYVVNSINNNLESIIKNLKMYYPEKRILSWLTDSVFIQTIVSDIHNCHSFQDGMKKLKKHDVDRKFLPKKVSVNDLIAKVLFYSRTLGLANDDLNQDDIEHLNTLEIKPFTIRVPQNHYELIEIGAKMRNCLGDGLYFDDIMEGDISVFVLEIEPNNPEVAVALEFDSIDEEWTIKEIQAKFGNPVDLKFQKDLLTVLNHYKPNAK